jgi:hypothetical protein
MTEKVEQDLNNVNISIEQILAVILKSIGPVKINLEELLNDYSSKMIAVDQDPETKQITFSLSDAPKAQTENQ